MNNRPYQLDGIIISIQDKLYAREPQLMQRLIPLMNRIGNIRQGLISEPFNGGTGLVRSKNYNQSLAKIENVKIRQRKIKAPRLRKFRRRNLESRKIKNFNALSIKKLKTKKPANKKISALPRDLLWMAK